MKFYEEVFAQQMKSGYSVCGDTRLCERTEKGLIYIICDGIGSGIYANISAITCANRLLELTHRGMSLHAASEMVAASMHHARTEDIPFSAFSAALILANGQFVVYTYEAPTPIFYQDGEARVLTPHFYTANYEIIGESTGTLRLGDALLLFSDGVSQAGLGRGCALGIGSEGVSEYINRRGLNCTEEELRSLPAQIVDMCHSLSGGRYEDDTTMALLLCREAVEVTILTGPPSKTSSDRKYVEEFIRATGKKAICGSTTADIVSRELGREAVLKEIGTLPGSPPEYYIEGIDFVTEGAVLLNQVYNILDENPDLFVENSLAERFCQMLMEADVVNLMIGNAQNEAHEGLLFKKVGINVRRKTVKLLAERLRTMGKLVLEKYY